jgi:hypothetical protein
MARRECVMNRRAFLGAVAGGLLGAPLTAETQQAGRIWRIAYLGNSSPSLESNLVEAFRRGLSERGYVVGKKHHHRVPMG